MTQSLSFGWLVTLTLFIGFIAGGFYTYDQIRQDAHAREFQACMDRAGKAGNSWMMQSQISLCQNLYTANAGGRYGPRSDRTISLAMVRRPIFNISY